MVNSFLKTWILPRMYGSSTFLPPSNFAVFDDWYFFPHCFQKGKKFNVNNDVSKDSPINRYAKTNIAQVQAWGLSAMIKIWGWSVRSPQAGYSEEAILSNRLCWIEPHNIVHLKHVLLYKPSILLANIQLFPQPWFYKKKRKKNTLFEVCDRQLWWNCII